METRASASNAPLPTSQEPVPLRPPPPPSQEPVPMRLARVALPAILGFTNAAAWPTQSITSDQRVLLSPTLESELPWNELVVSWNVQPADGTGLRLEASVSTPTREPTRFYGLGDWSLDDTAGLPRTSRKGERDEYGEVQTDTLVLKQPHHRLQLRLTLHGELARHPERLTLVTLSLADTRTRPESRPARPEAWNRTLDVPERSQVAYADGKAWCSPTSISMILGWWAQSLPRPDLNRDVPEVARGVFDPSWPGTGNWPFNTAYAGSFAGMTACAARLRDLRAVEDLVLAGIPVVLSVNAPALRGKPLARDGGHLILCVGFTSEGDVVANDPWARLEEGQRVRRVYARANVERAWDHAHRLAYLIAPTPLRAALPVDWR